ncbi:EAL domain-containing protein [Halomonas binhaiensis]|uniref:EAL domain-containing protein n=1 Tax=Halomonas binhaiensis TaxID=2562282 RepID=A0A5C1NH58_9GAMM|nr:EAL domain-containing protein [Halomonas binhaiensis]QEM82982.1 EAL domain-containing protein [Halomonas binhaiensis]
MPVSTSFRLTSEKRPLGRRWWPVVLYATFLLVMVCSITWLLREQYVAEIQGARGRLHAKSDLVVELVERSFSTTEQVLVGLSDLFDTAGQPIVMKHSDEVSAFLRKRGSGLDFIDELFVMDTAGRTIATSSSGASGPPELWQEQSPPRFQSSTHSDVLITPLYWSEQAQDYRILMALRLRDASGEVRALAVARIMPIKLDGMLSDIDLQSGESIAIIDSNGRLVTRKPAAKIRLGNVIAAASTTDSFQDGEGPWEYSRASRVDGKHRLYVAHRTDFVPLLVISGQGTEELLAGWTQRLWALVFAGLLLALLGGWLIRHILALWQAKEALRYEVIERQKAQEDAMSREARLRALIGSMQDMLFVFDTAGHFVYIHAGDESMLLTPKSELLGMNIREVLPADVSVQIDVALSDVESTRAPQLVDYCLELGDELHFFSALLSPLVYEEHGELRGVLAVVRDVTEEQAQQVQLRIAALAFETHLGMMITDVQGNILKVNHTFTRITGYIESEVVGRTPSMLSSELHEEEVHQRLWGAVLEYGSWQGELWSRRKNGETYPQWLTISAVKDECGQCTHYVGTLSDISESKAAEREIHQLAFFDTLTGLPNRRLMLERIDKALASHRRNEELGALIFLNLDDFKQVNEALGYQGGDELLKCMAQRLESVLQEGDSLARFGGDEFVVLIGELEASTQVECRAAECVARTLLDVLEQPITLAGQTLTVTASIGITLLRNDVTADELLRQADMALFQAKSLGRNMACFFDLEMQERIRQRTQLEKDLGQALGNEELFLVYQYQVDEFGKTIGAEALLRWRHPLRGLVPPSEFIPIAEQQQVIHQIGLWVIETACQTLVAWSQSDMWTTLSLSVNVSPKQFHAPDFVQRVDEILRRTKAPANKLKLEVTESLFMDDHEDIRQRMIALKSLGVTFALDDFGTGYSSFSYLKRLPLDQLKIDQSFVRDVLDNSTSSAIVASTIALAHTLELDVIAEGVENEAQRAWLLENGCHCFQGYLFSIPAPLDQGPETSCA